MGPTLFLHIPILTLLAQCTPVACIPLGSSGGSGVGSLLLLQLSRRYMQCAFPISSHPRLSLLGTDVAAPVSGRLHWGCSYGSTYSWMTGYSISAQWSASPISWPNPPGVSGLPAGWCGPGVYWCPGTAGSHLWRVLLWTFQPPVGRWCGTGKVMDLALYLLGTPESTVASPDASPSSTTRIFLLVRKLVSYLWIGPRIP